MRRIIRPICLVRHTLLALFHLKTLLRSGGRRARLKLAHSSADISLVSSQMHHAAHSSLSTKSTGASYTNTIGSSGSYVLDTYAVFVWGRTAQKVWSRTPLWKRAELLRNAAAKMRENAGVRTLPWRQTRGKLMVSSANSHTNATRIGWHLWEIGFIFSPGLPPGWTRSRARKFQALFAPENVSWYSC